MQTLEGRNCLFAGASGGDGVNAVKALCKAGMNVIMMTHQPTQAQSLLDEMEQLGYPGRCTAVQDGNARDPQVPDEEVYREVYETYGSIDVIISNIGGDGFEDSIDSVTPALMVREVSQLLGGAHSMLYYALPYLRKSRAPRVIFMTTVEGVQGGTRESYTNAVAKGAVLALAKNSAARLAAEGICVNCIEKGAIERVQHGKVSPGGEIFKDTSVMLPDIPMGRMGTPEDLAQVICFLASEEASYMTGAVIDLSGGLSLA
ncbi:MAG: SDR family oxidoreductase [Clostridiales bacterium]|nr:SDR family oxidoreductase [Clostridiales bacterium]